MRGIHKLTDNPQVNAENRRARAGTPRARAAPLPSAPAKSLLGQQPPSPTQVSERREEAPGKQTDGASSCRKKRVKIDDGPEDLVPSRVGLRVRIRVAPALSSYLQVDSGAAREQSRACAALLLRRQSGPAETPSQRHYPDGIILERWAKSFRNAEPWPARPYRYRATKRFVNTVARSIRPPRWPTMPRRVRHSFAIAGAIRLASMRSSGSLLAAVKQLRTNSQLGPQETRNV